VAHNEDDQPATDELAEQNASGDSDDAFDEHLEKLPSEFECTQDGNWAKRDVE
jgi:hypothetical protein